jgi:malonyl-CoA/methylmalonyl-CoA synthetase
MSERNFNLMSRFQPRFDAQARKEFLSTELRRSYTYADIASSSAKLANFLSEIGIRPGDRVSVQVEKSPQSLCLYLACLRAGFVYHPLNLGYKAAELDYFLDNAEPSVLVCDSRNLDSLRATVGRNNIKHLLTLDTGGDGSLIERSADSSDEFTTVQSDADDLAALLYSSGTTGRPKGIMLTHENLHANIKALQEAWAFTDSDRLLHALPIFHVHGLFVALGCVMLSGASMRWLATYNVAEVIRYLPECTVMMGVPTYYTRLLRDENFGAQVCENVRLFISGSAPLLAETFADFEARTGHRILERYGMTETNMNTSNPYVGMRKPGTVGPPLPGVEVRIVDDQGGEVAANDIGNLQVRGPNVFKGYWKMPDKTADDFSDDGFFDTGDKGIIDDDGYVSIVGRAKDLVISGGLNVYPKEVEIFIDDLTGVKESAVIGVPHADFGEAVVAVVVVEPGAEIVEDDVITACKENIANFKVPKRVLFVDELPRNTMAKVQKNVLRKTYKDLLA